MNRETKYIIPNHSLWITARTCVTGRCFYQVRENHANDRGISEIPVSKAWANSFRKGESHVLNSHPHEA